MFLRAMSSTNLYPVCLGMVKIWTLLYCSSNPSFRRCRNRLKLDCVDRVPMSCMLGILDTRTSLAIDFQSIQDWMPVNTRLQID